MKVTAVSAALLLASTFAQCAGSAEMPKCNDNGSTQESNACVYDELNSADRAMNQTYQSKLSSLPRSARDVLRAEQRAWLKARDPQCKEDAKEMEGQSAWVSEFYGCVAAATRTRTQQLQRWESR